MYSDYFLLYSFVYSHAFQIPSATVLTVWQEPPPLLLLRLRRVQVLKPHRVARQVVGSKALGKPPHVRMLAVTQGLTLGTGAIGQALGYTRAARLHDQC